MIYYCSQKMSCVPPAMYRDRFVNYIDTVIQNSGGSLQKPSISEVIEEETKAKGNN